MKIVRVRIAVVIDEKGNWNAAGWATANDKDVAAAATDCFEQIGNEAVHFVEADVEIPEPKTVEGTVVKSVE